MATKQLTLDALKDFDLGKVDVAFQQALRAAAQDCIDRPGETKARSVTLAFAMAPIVEVEGHCDSVKAEFQIQTTLPKKVSKRYEFFVDKRGNLSFSEHAPDSRDQLTFDDIDPNTGRVVR